MSLRPAPAPSPGPAPGSTATAAAPPAPPVSTPHPRPRADWRRVRLALLVQGYDATGGMEQSSRLLARELSRAGGRVVVLTSFPSPDGRLLPTVERTPGGPTVVRFPWPTGLHYTLAELSFYARVLIWLLLRRPPVRAFHGVWGPTCGALASLLGLLTRRPSVVRLTCSGSPGDMAALGRHPLRGLIHALLRRSTAVACPGEEIAREVLAAAGPSPVRLVPNGVDTERFHPPAAPATPAPRDPGLVLSVQRLRPQKATTRLLGAWALVEPTVPHARLEIVGDGPEEERVRAHARALRLARAHLAGRRDDVPELLRRASLFVHASDAEGLPNALLEAMASGAPCLATDIPANREALGEAGLLVPPDARSIAQGIRELLGDPERARALGLLARARAVERFGLSLMVGRYAALYLGSDAPGADEPGADDPGAD